jgi:uncharacterized SAM-binding protein YcdF (DUF218 family)
MQVKESSANAAKFARDGLTGSSSAPRRAAYRRRLGIIAATLLLMLAAIAAFRGIGRWLIVQDPLDRSDAIVVLSGGMPYRAIEAAKIYNEGMAPQVWLTHPANPSDVLNQMGIPFEGEETYSRAVLLHEGVPPSAIQILPVEIVNTEDEERVIIAGMQAARAHRVIVVTSPPHTRRVRALWRKLAPPGLALIVRPAMEDDFDANHWWGTTRDSLAVIREITGLLNTWAGLPLRPAQR